MDTSTQGPSEVTFTVTAESETPQFDISEIEKNIPKPFRKMAKPAIEWVESVEARLKILTENSLNEDGVKSAMTEWANEERKKQAQRMRQMPQMQQGMPQASGGVMQYLSAARELGLVGGGGMDEEMGKLNKKLLEVSIDSVLKKNDFMEAIANAIVGKIAGSAAQKVADEAFKVE